MPNSPESDRQEGVREQGVPAQGAAQQSAAQQGGAEPGNAAQPGAPQPGAGQQASAPPDAIDLNAELAELEDRYKRALADLDNYRKRAGREIERRVAEARETLLRDWLEAVDSVERALRMEAPDHPALAGLRAVLEQMEGILERYGVKRIGATGERFDPERHEAVGVVTTDKVPDHAIVDVARSGWALGDKVLRPAQVIVARHEDQPAARGREEGGPGSG